jgi:hypothetical protein
MPHGLTRHHFQLVKMKAEFAWFQKWIRGVEGWVDWQAILDTMPKEEIE